MAFYILKVFNSKGSQIGSFDFTAVADGEAEAAVAELQPIIATHELWRGRRWLNTWAPRPRARKTRPRKRGKSIAASRLTSSPQQANVQPLTGFPRTPCGR